MKYDKIPDGTKIYDEYKNAFLGMAEKSDGSKMVVYSTEKCIEILAKDMESPEDAEEHEDAYSMAVEYFYYNTVVAWFGEETPMFGTFIKKED